MADKEGARADAQFIVISQVPDVCKTPPVGTPVPYPIVAFLSDRVRESPNVRFRGKWVMTRNSRVTKVIGDEAGVMGGVKSGVNMGFCKPVSNWSPTVRVNTYNILHQQNTVMEMNCAGPDGAGNTIGTVKFLGLSDSAPMGPEGPSPGDPPVVPEIPAERGFIGNLVSVNGIAGLAQMAPQLATMDWSNPMSALGAIGGVCGIGGMGGLAQAVGYAQKAAAIIKDPKAALGLLGPLAGMVGIPGGQLLGLVNVNWSNPGSVIGAGANLAGIAGCLGGGGSRTVVNPMLKTQN